MATILDEKIAKEAAQCMRDAGILEAGKPNPGQLTNVKPSPNVLTDLLGGTVRTTSYEVDKVTGHQNFTIQNHDVSYSGLKKATQCVDVAMKNNLPTPLGPRDETVAYRGK